MGRRQPKRRRGTATPLVDGNYDPSYRIMKLERYAQLGGERCRATVLYALHRWSSFAFVTPRHRRAVAISVLEELADKGCLALVSCGALAAGRELPRYRSRDVDALAALGFRTAATVVASILLPTEARQVRGFPSMEEAYKHLTAELVHGLLEVSALGLVQAGVDEENERDQAERDERRRQQLARAQRDPS